MSKNIIIQEGGQGKQLTADKLKTNLVGGGSCMWVPEDETTLGTKIITENGTYKAIDDGYYGYSEVTVNGIGSVKGKDDDGDDAEATVDPETGRIEIKKLPSSINVVTPPRVTEYADGATIDFSGIVVKAYLRSGDVWTDENHPNGIIPMSELVFPVAVADVSQAEGVIEATSDLVNLPVPFGYSVICIQDNPHNTYSYSAVGGAIAVMAYNYTQFLCASEYQSAANSNWSRMPKDEQGGQPASGSDTLPMDLSYTHNGKTVHYVKWGQTWKYDTVSIDNAPALTREVAWTIVFGNIIDERNKQSIPVQWASDNGILESSFDITVNASMGGATGGGGTAGETGAGRND